MGRLIAVVLFIALMVPAGLLARGWSLAADRRAVASAAVEFVPTTPPATAQLTRASVYVMVGKIAADDVEAVKAINSEVSDLLGQMQEGLRNLDVKSIRDAANKAKGIGQMLSPDAAVRIQLAIDAARSSARKIVQAGETAAAEIDLRAVRLVTEARTAFLDLDEAKAVAAPRQESRALDLAPEHPVAKAKKPKARALEL